AVRAFDPYRKLSRPAESTSSKFPDHSRRGAGFGDTVVMTLTGNVQNEHPEMLMLAKITSAALAGAIAFSPVAQACTGIELTAKEGAVVAARTLEFGIDPKSEAMIIPAGTSISGTLPDGGKGISYVTKYGVVGANGFGQPAILDGI